MSQASTDRAMLLEAELPYEKFRQVTLSLIRECDHGRAPERWQEAIRKTFEDRFVKAAEDKETQRRIHKTRERELSSTLEGRSAAVKSLREIIEKLSPGYFTPEHAKRAEVCGE